MIQNLKDRISIKNMQTDKTFIDFKFEKFPGIIQKLYTVIVMHHDIYNSMMYNSNSYVFYLNNDKTLIRKS